MTDKNSDKRTGGLFRSGRFTYQSGSGSFRERASSIPPTKEQLEEMSKKGRALHRPIPGPAEQFPEPDDAIHQDSEVLPTADSGEPATSNLVSPAASRIQFGVMGVEQGDNPSDGTGVSDQTSFLVTTNQQVWGYARDSTSGHTWMTLNDFFAGSLISPPSAVNTFDPYIVPDPTAGQFVAVSLNYFGTGEPGIYLASTQNGDVLGDWQNTWISCESLGMPSNLWFDYPRVGTSAEFLTITANVIDSNNKYVDTYVLVVDKLTYYTGDQLELDLFTGGMFTMVPVITYDALDPHYLVTQGMVNDFSGHNSIRLFTVVGDFDTDNVAINGPAGVTANLPFRAVAPHYVGPQEGSANLIDVGDTRMQSAVLRNGSVWCCHMIFLPLQGTVFNTGIQCYEVDPVTMKLIQAARYYDTSQNWYYAYPSIAVNSLGDVLIGMAAFNSDYYPQGVYTCRSVHDALDTLRKKNSALNSSQPWTLNNRWGDYSGTIVDPTDDLSFWTLQELAIDGAQWQTFWMQVPQITGN